MSLNALKYHAFLKSILFWLQTYKVSSYLLTKLQNIKNTRWWCFNALTVQVPGPHLEILLRRCCCDPMSHSCRAKSWVALNTNLHIENMLYCKKKRKKCPLSTYFSFTWAWCWSARLCSASWLRCRPCCSRSGPLFSGRCCCPGRWPERCPESAGATRSGTETAGPGEAEGKQRWKKNVC